MNVITSTMQAIRNKVAGNIILILGTILFGCFSNSQSLQAQDALVTFYEKQDLNGRKYICNSEAEWMNVLNEMAFRPSSMVVAENCKVTLYTVVSFVKPTVFYGGTYDKIPFGTTNSLVALPNVESIKVEKIQPVPLVDVFFTFKFPTFHNNKLDAKEVTYHQTLGVGNNFNEELIKPDIPRSPMLPKNVVITDEKRFEKIVIPKGFTITISEADGEVSKTRTPLSLPLKSHLNLDRDRNPILPNDSEITSFFTEQITYKNDDLGFSPDIIINTEAAYKIKEIKLDEGKPVPGNKDEEMVAEQRITNTIDSTIASLSSKFSLTETVSATNAWEKTTSNSKAVGLALGASVGVTVSGAPLGVGVSGTTNVSVEASITKSITQSFSTGKSETASTSYEFETSCSTDCPPGKTCTLQAFWTPVAKKYNVETVLIRCEPQTGTEIPGTEITVKSTLTVKHASELRCENGVVEE